MTPTLASNMRKTKSACLAAASVCFIIDAMSSLPARLLSCRVDKEEDDDENASPTKKKKATPGKAKGKKKPVADAEGEDDTIAVKSEFVEQAGDDN